MNTTENTQPVDAAAAQNDSNRMHPTTGGWSNGFDEWQAMDIALDGGDLQSDGMWPNVHTNVKSGGWQNHNEQTLHVHTHMKSGGWQNHNERGMAAPRRS